MPQSKEGWWAVRGSGRASKELKGQLLKGRRLAREVHRTVTVAARDGLGEKVAGRLLDVEGDALATVGMTVIGGRLRTGAKAFEESSGTL